MNINRRLTSIAVLAITLAAINGHSQTKASRVAAGNRAQGKSVLTTRTFNAPVSEVWKYWVDSEYVKKWWGPVGFTCPVAKMDVRVGGTSLVCMRTPEGQDLYSTWKYTKIVPLKQIEFIHNLADKNGKKADPTSLGLPSDFPRDVRNVITFKALGDSKTEVTINEYGYPTDQWVNLSRMGLEQCLNKMAASLSSH